MCVSFRTLHHRWQPCFESHCCSRFSHSTPIPSPHPRTRRHLDPSERRDRKSTRLNSSHMSISYAVFCLKKKTALARLVELELLLELLLALVDRLHALAGLRDSALQRVDLAVARGVDLLLVAVRVDQRHVHALLLRLVADRGLRLLELGGARLELLLARRRIDLATHLAAHGHLVHDFFFNDTATTEIYTLSLHDALPI